MKKKKEKFTNWISPSTTILPEVNSPDIKVEYHTAEYIAQLVAECGVMCYPENTIIGPSTVQYLFTLSNLKQFKAVKRMTDALGARLRTKVILTETDRADFALSIPRKERMTVQLRRCLDTDAYLAVRGATGAVIGLSADNRTIAVDLAKMPHLLIAGTTGSGKSVSVRSIISSILFSATPSALDIVLIDPKKMDFPMFDGLPHLPIPVVTEVYGAISTLNRICQVMDRRYEEIKSGITNHKKMLVVIDELADLMLTSGKAVEEPIVRIAQLGRAAGIHLVIATQRPMATVVTGLIKANLPARLALRVMSTYDSNIIGVPGANNLANHGDGLFLAPDGNPAVRLQSPFTSESDVKTIVDYWTSPRCKANINKDGYLEDLTGNVRTNMGKFN